MGGFLLLTRDTVREPAGKKLRYRSSTPFLSVQIYRKCLASTYHGWGLQSLVSEKRKGSKIEERREKGRE